MNRLTNHMNRLTSHSTQPRHFAMLSRLLLSRNREELTVSAEAPGLCSIQADEFAEFVRLAQSNHVIVRALRVFRDWMLETGDSQRAQWTEAPLAAEQSRIALALNYVREICEAFRQQGHGILVIKTLDHWPDFGSDIDLYTDAPADQVCVLMQKKFKASIADRSWGDQMACKWNFNLPGLSEPVEMHIGRLGQTGEQQKLASKLVGRARWIGIDGEVYPVAHVADRILISTLQRMYRHFYFRLCDIVDSASLVREGAVDFSQLGSFAADAGIWEGVASYLRIISDYVERFTKLPLDLPETVKGAARFGGEEVFVRGDFLRVPVIPQSVVLYRSQLAGLLRRGELRNSARLGMLPWLATAAAVGYKLTGSDKGIW